MNIFKYVTGQKTSINLSSTIILQNCLARSCVPKNFFSSCELPTICVKSLGEIVSYFCRDNNESQAETGESKGHYLNATAGTCE